MDFGNAERMEELGQLLGSAGVLLAGTPHAGGMGYEPLFDLVRDRFAAIRMLGAAPFAGWSVVDFGASGEPAVTVDGSLIEETPPPSYYLALCAPEPEELDAYALIQVPGLDADDTSEETSADGGDDLTDALLDARRHSEELEGSLAVRLGELEALRVQLTEAVGDDGRAERLGRQTIPAPREEISAVEADAPVERAAGGGEEYERLERALRDRGRELLDAQQELERRASLVRDLAEQVQEQREASAAAAPSASESHPALDEAMSRATEAEAHRAEAEFRVDELRGQLAHHEEHGDGVGTQMAGLEGTVRGLRARVAELDELYGQARARLELAEDDRTRESTRSADLERDLAEAREQVELEMVRARGAAAEVAESEGGRAEVLGEELEGVKRGFELRISELTQDKSQAVAALEGLQVQVAQLGGQLAGTQARLADREAAFALQTAPAPQEGVPTSDPTSDPETEARVAELEEQLAQARQTTAQTQEELASAAADRDRLEGELAQQSERAAETEGLRARMDELDRGLDAQSEQAAAADTLRERGDGARGGPGG